MRKVDDVEVVAWIGVENEVREGWIKAGFTTHARASGALQPQPPDPHTPQTKVSSPLIGFKEQ